MSFRCTSQLFFARSLCFAVVVIAVIAVVVSAASPAEANCSMTTVAAIATEYNKLGGPEGPLGCPVGAQHAGVDIAGALVQQFEHGAITYTPSFAPHMTLAGYVRGSLATIVWDNVDPDFAGYDVLTAGGSLSSPKYAALRQNGGSSGEAHLTLPSYGESITLAACGARRSRFNSKIAPQGPLSCNDYVQDGGILAQGFVLTPAMGVFPTPTPAPTPAPALTGFLQYDDNSISVPSASSLYGFTHLTLYQNGNYKWTMHFHNSDIFADYDITLAAAVVTDIGVAFTFEQKGHIPDGVSDLDPPAITGNDPRIAHYWTSLVPEAGVWGVAASVTEMNGVSPAPPAALLQLATHPIDKIYTVYP
jgi:hypothetical protein